MPDFCYRCPLAEHALRDLEGAWSSLDPIYRRGFGDAVRYILKGGGCPGRCELEPFLTLTSPENLARPRGRRLVMDLDGTLLDVVTPILHHVNMLRAVLHKPAFVETDIKGYNLYPVFAEGDGQGSLYEFFRQHSDIWFFATPYAGAREFVRATLELAQSAGVPFVLYSALTVVEEFVVKHKTVQQEFGEDLAGVFKGGFGSKAELFAPGDVAVDDCTANLEAVERAGGRAVCIARPWNDPAGSTGFAGKRYDYEGALKRIEGLLKR